ncbi:MULTISPECIES: nuclear transport factor 2 family protein [Prosthecochloris]|uniref:DUF4440 domain-containing protein n=1 Tax=Prosthecochloris vibrioformis TaxID=1098 RepID=A0A5C4RY31_PROVB|nr:MULTISPECIES: nuclear transport factor 2 family protein [Prosthecochloris]ANT65428.1 hypothetical protein Ptc2401_01692 [Prosthecochloris sp. CIB 2401]TNJ35922.1 DUF4440 domain-containing protein [Prosthecochloris vibrioformis]
MAQRPEDILESWVLAVNAGDCDRIMSLYDERAVLIPTFSNRTLSTPEALREYFQKLGSREQLKVWLHRKKLHVQSIGGSIFALSGLYCWEFMVDDELLRFEARFTYVLDTESERPIRHHHSSQIPRML